MTKRYPRRTDEEWMNLIQECRSSGLSDKCWCEEHHITISNFYYQICRLRKMACEILEPVHSSLVRKQEVVQLSFDGPIDYPAPEKPSGLNISLETAIRIMVSGFQIEVTNVAASETVFNTLSALQKLC